MRSAALQPGMHFYQSLCAQQSAQGHRNNGFIPKRIQVIADEAHTQARRACPQRTTLQPQVKPVEGRHLTGHSGGQHLQTRILRRSAGD